MCTNTTKMSMRSASPSPAQRAPARALPLTRCSMPNIANGSAKSMRPRAMRTFCMDASLLVERRRGAMALAFLALVAVQGRPQADERYDRYRRPERVLAALGLAPGQRVADVGAGSGYLTFRLLDAVGPAG